MNSREETLQQALKDIKNGVYSINKAAEAYKLNRGTLQNRLRSRTIPRRIAHEQRQRLTPPQEEFLADWILEQDLQGHPPSHARARDMAARILRMNGDTQPLGKRWINSFIQRNPRVASVIGRRVKAIRI